MTNGRGAMAKNRVLSPLPALADEQATASQPNSQIRLSASAGTGKTQVLSARVLRLLLNGNRPESILCLTFTKAGAAEMADRIHERLGAWVTMKGGDLAKDLKSLGESHGPEALSEARALFAKVLDARGSGLRIQTIHGFCQTLLGSFPAEAGLPPGFRPIEGREEELLFSKALADMVENAERDGRMGEIDRLKSTAKRLSEDATRSFLRNCARHPDEMEAIGPGVEAKVRAWLGLYEADVEAIVEAGCADGGFDVAGLARIKALNIEWGTKRAQEKIDAINGWTKLPVKDRVRSLDLIHSVWATTAGEPKTTGKGWAPQTEDYPPLVAAQFAHFSGLIALRQLADTAQAIADALRVGKAYAEAYALAKRAAGVVDFNDLIRSTVVLLKKPGIGDWVKFKLDQSIDHVLVDEAQDTNADQWDIVKALSGDFFAGAGAKGEGVRTIFAVGDFKQAIFGFQGTDPREFERATTHFADAAQAVGQEFHKLSLGLSYRSTQPILSVTDQILTMLGHDAFGLPSEPSPHRSSIIGSGTVTLLPPVMSVPDADEEKPGDDSEDEEAALAPADLVWAGQLAQMIKSWIDGGLRLNNQDRVVEPGDIMVLVRNRGALARLIVSRLYQEDVAVAGIDRLQLGAPIVVQDLLACIRFVLQPEDDLSLACVLVSPLIGWSQAQLYDRAKQRGKKSLWQHLGEHKPAMLLEILNRTDKNTPYQFLESILSDPVFEGRKKLIGRLGDEARDPINELLNAALAFEEQSSPSLQLFLDWFDRGDVEIKRDPSKPDNAVRVMTVHGAKGLQAPVVVLADATSDPEFRTSRELQWKIDDDLTIPLFRPTKIERVGSLTSSAEDQDRRDLEEHWRLLYVAMTRAEEHLFIGGALRPKQIPNGMGPKCWHVQIDAALQNMDTQLEDGARVLRHVEAVKSSKKRGNALEKWSGALPDWATKAAAEESKPPRPLAPSAIEVADAETHPPPSDEMRAAARRGVNLHSLFERLPLVMPDERRHAADRWLENAAGVADPHDRAELIDAAMSVIERPDFAHIFAPDALAEAPLAGVVNGRVIAGAVDRLLVTETEVLVVDFKTGRRVPKSADGVSRHHKAQMGAYAAVLAGMFPGRTIRAALLYTNEAKLIELPWSMLEAHKPNFTETNEQLAIGG
jgi:ATP-dependent helicase/nuclease subunit A